MPECNYEPTSVYRYFDEFDLLLYVGMTSRGTVRNSEHNKDKAWWPYVARQQVSHHQSRQEAHEVEVALIRQFRPPFNVQHNPGHEKTAAAYFVTREAIRPVIGADPLVMATALGRRLPVGIDTDGPRAAVRFHLEHLPIVKRLTLNKPECHIRDWDSGKTVGLLMAIEQRGPCVVALGNLSRDWRDSRGIAQLKVLLAKSGPQFVLAHVRAMSVDRRMSTDTAA